MSIPLSGTRSLFAYVMRRRSGQGALALCCLILLAAGAPRGEFRPLESHSETRIPRIETFVAAEEFKIGNAIGGRMLGAVGWNFAEHFLGVVEHNIPESQANAWTLLYTTGDKSLIEASGGEGSIVRFLPHIHHFLVLGGKGPSHLDGRSNFAYVRSDMDGRLWAVHWNVNSANEWNIGAVFVPHPLLDWRSGSRLFSIWTVPYNSF